MIAKNAADTIATSLQSLQFCDQIIVIVDSTSTDNTEAIARGLAHHVESRTWEGFASSKTYALSRGEGQWLLSIDSDEAVTPILRQSILEAIMGDSGEYDGFLMRRHTRFLGRYLTHGDWGRDCVLRIVRRTKCEMNDAVIHESLKNPGSTRLLDGVLLHQGERSVDELRRKMERYTTLSAQQMFDQGRRISVFALWFIPPFRFIRSYLLRLGLLDGRPGFIQAWYSAVYVFTRYSKLRELHRQRRQT